MGRRKGPMSYSATLVLQAISQGAGYGFEIMREAALPSGTVYPLLRRLEAGGLVKSHWEEDEEVKGEGRPRRRYYEVTPEGLAALAVGRERILAQRALLEGGEGEPAA